MPRRAGCITNRSLYMIEYKRKNKEKLKIYNDNYTKTHDLAAKQLIYDRARAEYKSFSKALLRMLNNLYEEPTTSV